MQQQDFLWIRGQDGFVQVQMVPPTPVTNWSVQFDVYKRFGGSTPLYSRYGYSGYHNGESGVTLQNATTGLFSVRIDAAATSGLEYGNYAATFRRVDSGNVTPLSEGYQITNP